MYHSVPVVRLITFVNEGNTAGYVDVGRTCTLYALCSDQTIGKTGGNGPGRLERLEEMGQHSPRRLERLKETGQRTIGKAGGSEAT